MTASRRDISFFFKSRRKEKDKKELHVPTESVQSPLFKITYSVVVFWQFLKLFVIFNSPSYI